jgi:hypothetical protein
MTHNVTDRRHGTYICRALTLDERAALLRREGLYSSLISEWRKQRDQGALQAFGRSPSNPGECRRARM